MYCSCRESVSSQHHMRQLKPPIIPTLASVGSHTPFTYLRTETDTQYKTKMKAFKITVLENVNQNWTSYPSAQIRHISHCHRAGPLSVTCVTVNVGIFKGKTCTLATPDS